MTAAEVAFRDVTRAAWDAFVSSPPRIAYRVTAHEHDAWYDRNVRYAIVYDTRTGMAHRRDIVFKEEADERPFLAAPNLDAVGAFRTSMTSDRHGVVFSAFDEVPLDLPAPDAPGTHVDTWTAANGAYHAEFDGADRSGTTLDLVPTERYRAEHRAWRAAKISFDAATHVPIVVTLRSDDGGVLTLVYQTVAGVRVLAKATFDDDATFFLNAAIQHAKEHVHFDAVFEGYTFP